MLKFRPDKVHHSIDMRTLDGSHKKYVMYFKKRKEDLPKKKIKLQKLKKKLADLDSMSGDKLTYADVEKRSVTKNSIRELENEIEDIETNRSEMEYYSISNEILTDYYESFENDDVEMENCDEVEAMENPVATEELSDLDKLNLMNKKKRKPKRVAKKRYNKKTVKTNTDHIMSYLDPESTSKQKTEVIQEHKKATLLDDYLSLVDKEYTSTKRCKFNPIKYCSGCDAEKTLIQSDGLSVCIECGEAEMVIVESDRPNYKDPVPEKSGYPYKRIDDWSVTGRYGLARGLFLFSLNLYIDSVEMWTLMNRH